MTTPRLSVVVPSVNGLADLLGCIQALEVESRSVPLEIIVVDRLGPEVRDRVVQQYPAVKVLAADSSTTIPEMRARAFEVATAPSVALIEDHVIVPPGWAASLLEAQDRGEDVVGGAVENAATERWIDWAAFLCEYSQLLPPLPDGPAAGLTGNNTVYRKSLLDRYRTVLAEGKWENRLHDAMRSDGITLYCRPAIRVGHKKHYTFWEYFSQRYLYSRSFAGMRVASASIARRCAFTVGALALPAVVFARVVSTVWRKGRHRAELLVSLPLIALFSVAWGAGEVVGYALGPGNALARVR